MSVVLDTNTAILAAIVTQDDDPPNPAQEILPELAERYGFIAPALIAWEVGNVVHHKEPAAFGADEQERTEAVALILQGIDLSLPSPEGTSRTGRLAERYALTFYDAAFLELADRHEGSLLVTEDRRLARAAREHLGERRSMTAWRAWDLLQRGDI